MREQPQSADLSETVERVRRGPGRPADPTIAGRRRAELVEAAYRVFTRDGYATSGIADITAELGVGQSTFYRYFKNKRDILDSVVDYGYQRIFDAMFDVAQPEGAIALMSQPITTDDLAAAWADGLSRLWRTLRDDPGLAKIVFFEMTAIDNQLTERLFALNDVIATITASILQRAVDVGAIPAPDDLQATARVLNAMVVPIAIHAVQPNASDSDATALIEASAALLRNGLIR